MERAILARHGETTYNLRLALNGDPGVSCPLTEKGEEQARALGREIADEPIDRCFTSGFERTKRTAELALAGRGVPFEVVPELGDPNYGSFEGALLEEYRAWASASPSHAEPPGPGESRLAIVDRYTRGFRRVLERPGGAALVVCHSLPIAYVVGALDGVAPGPRVPLVDPARPYRLDAAELERALAVLEDWLRAPTW